MAHMIPGGKMSKRRYTFCLALTAVVALTAPMACAPKNDSLAHQYETDSIMNYSWDYLKGRPGQFLTSYDRSAIETLYP